MATGTITPVSVAVDVGTACVAKHKEELCGDNVQVFCEPDATTVVMSDGLGSGVKANILATLTTKIALGMLRRHVDVDTVFETIADTLPVCKVRELAYATLTIVRVHGDGRTKLIEYDNPKVIVLRQRKPITIARQEREICGKQVYEAEFVLQPEDLLILVSDGVIHAGVGGLFKLGLGFDGLLKYLPQPEATDDFHQVFADQLVELAASCYLGEPGDDSTAVVMRLRTPRRTVVLTGPPADASDDDAVVRHFMDTEATSRVVCGGTTSQVVGRVLGKRIKTSIDYVDPSVPPVATINGVDLVTEGILTLNKSYDRLRSLQDGKALPDSEDGATLLAKAFLRSDQIHFLLGTASNPAHTYLDQLVQLASRKNIVQRISELLRSMGKDVEVDMV